ncbi:MAG: glycine--tRNA ligase [Candidatus Jorgensenbacteria bacterium]
MDLLEKIVSLAKRRGFVYPGSEIYGGFAGTYDFGHYGVALRHNIVEMWKRDLQKHGEIAFIESSIFSAPKVWEASGHVSGFSDPLVICSACHAKYRADHLLGSVGVAADEKMTEAELNVLFDAHRKDLKCQSCGKKNFGRVTAKSLLVTSTLGVFEEGDQEVYLRGETAQGIYINFKNVLNTGSYSVPFGIAQVGKVFRNEISPRQFLFRMREFEQMEMQYFVHPRDAQKAYECWKKARMEYYTEVLGIAKEKLRWEQHKHLVFYAKDAWDIQYEFPFGWNELEGVHYRGDYDLSQHQKFSGADTTVYEEETKERYTPHVVETSVGVERTILALLCDAYSEDGKRVVMKFHPKIAPVKVAVFPLLANKPDLVKLARKIYDELKQEFVVAWDDRGNIGKRYYAQDEIGTPFCITVDFDSLEKNDVTVRDRDTMKQERVKIQELKEYIQKRLE